MSAHVGEVTLLKSGHIRPEPEVGTDGLPERFYVRGRKPSQMAVNHEEGFKLVAVVLRQLHGEGC